MSTDKKKREKKTKKHEAQSETKKKTQSSSSNSNTSWSLREILNRRHKRRREWVKQVQQYVKVMKPVAVADQPDQPLLRFETIRQVTGNELNDWEDITQNTAAFHFEWPQLEIRRVPLHSLGEEQCETEGVFVKAGQRVLSGTFIPYFGVLFQRNVNYPSCLSKSLLISNCANYAIDFYHDDLLHTLDANPSLYPWVTPEGFKIALRGLGIAAKINEPLRRPLTARHLDREKNEVGEAAEGSEEESSQDQVANCLLIDSTETPCPWSPMCFIYVLRDIEEDEQLTVYYGDHYPRCALHRHNLSPTYQVREAAEEVAFNEIFGHQREIEAWSHHFLSDYMKTIFIETPHSSSSETIPPSPNPI